MGDVMIEMFITYAGMSTALLAVIAIHLFLWWQAIRAIVIRTRRTYEVAVIQRALNEYFARKNSRKKPLEPVEYAVTGVSYSRHEKPGKPSSLRVTYACGSRRFSEWVCLEHGGIPRVRAMSWWMQRDREGITPRSVDAALDGATDRLAVPVAILVREHAKYPEIVGHVFADQLRAAESEQ